MIPAVVAALLLFVALGRHPYGYYRFLRWWVFLAAIVVSWVAWQSRAQWRIWVFAGIAILFNPLAPVYLARSTWRVIDILSAIAFVGATAIEPQRGWPGPRDSSGHPGP
ncbi:MAG: hypothetical protein C4344_06470 [Acidimicrobiia bacterium]